VANRSRYGRSTAVDIAGGTNVITIPWFACQLCSQARGDPTTGAAAMLGRFGRRRDKLLASIAMARRWLEQLVSGEAIDIEARAGREGLTERSMRMMLSLPSWRPTLSKPLRLHRCREVWRVQADDLPADWTEQPPRGWTNDAVLNAT